MYYGVAFAVINMKGGLDQDMERSRHGLQRKKPQQAECQVLRLPARCFRERGHGYCTFARSEYVRLDLLKF